MSSTKLYLTEGTVMFALAFGGAFGTHELWQREIWFPMAMLGAVSVVACIGAIIAMVGLLETDSQGGGGKA
jgi:hypothetical protein